MNRSLILIALAMFAWGMGEGLFFFFQPIYMEQLGANPLQIGAILGGFGLAMTLSHVPAGYLADRLGRKPLLVAAWTLGLIATWIMALADTLPGFVIGLLIYGTTMFVMSPLYSYVTAARGNLSIGRAITLISASFNSGAVLGPWIGGQVGDLFGLRQNYFAAGCLFIASSFVILLIRPQPVNQSTLGGEDYGWIFNPRLRIYLGVIFLAFFATYLPQPLSPNFLVNQSGLNLSQTGTLYSISSIGVVVLNLVLGGLSARTGFMLAQAAVATFAAILWRASGFPWYILGYFLLGGFKTSRSLGIAQVRQLVPETRMGLAYGVAETVAGFAVLLAPLLAGYLYQLDPSAMYVLGTLLIGLSIITSGRFSPQAVAATDLSPGSTLEI
jgi:MFS family permease